MTSDIGKLPDETAECVTAHPGLRDPARLARHREARKVYVDELLHPPDTRSTSYPVIAAVLVAILVGGFMFAPLPTTAGRDCDANPGPGINWNGCTFESLVAPGVNLAGANLRSVSLRGADLFGGVSSRRMCRLRPCPGRFCVAPISIGPCWWGQICSRSICHSALCARLICLTPT